VDAVSSLVAERVSFRVTSVDRVFVAGYIPGLQYEGGVVRFLLGRGYPIPSPVGLARNHDRLVAEIEGFAAGRGVEVVRFAKRQSKEEVARPYLEAAERDGRAGVVLVGKAQERVAGWRGFKDPSSPRHCKAHPHFTWRRQWLFVDHFYFYLWDRQWGPAFVKLCAYAPYPLWVWCNGHQWAKRQLTQAGIGFQALDNGLRACQDPATAQQLCHWMSAGHLRAGLERWLSWLPSALTSQDRAGGFGYDFSVRQLEVSDTAVFDRPQTGRAWFEAAIREHLDLGRPEQAGPGRGPPHPPQRHTSDPGTVRHPGGDPRDRPAPADPLQGVQGQGVLQGAACAACGDHHQRPRRLRRWAPAHR
jgi:hypothetical protein